jgi:protein ImuB
VPARACSAGIIVIWLCIRLPQLAREAQAASAAAAMERLAAWAYQWSSQVSYRLSDPALLWLELGASEHLFGGYAALLQRLEAGLTQLGLSHTCALAPSPHGAALLTQAERQRCVYTRAQLRLRLESAPLEWLELPPEVIAALHSAGLRRIGQLLALPAAAIARRFGPHTSRYLRQLLGQQSDPRSAWQLPVTYQARCEFGCELHDTTALLFPLQRLLLEFQGYLRGRDCAVLRFTLKLEHYRHPASDLTIGLSAPGREAAQFLQLARERLHTLILPAPVSGLCLQALEFTAPEVVQADFFGSPAQQLQQLQLLLDRVRSRLGVDQVQGLALRADYRPERAWDFASPAQPRSDRSSAVTDEHQPARPCFLATEPQRIAAPAQLLSGPERIESGWWERADTARDYYIAQAADGARLWVFRDLHNGGWYLQGLWT